MIERVVRMYFKPEEVDAFLELFNSSSKMIRNFPGCEHLELWRDPKDESVFMTFSRWRSEEHLDNYRNSELFGEVWSKTKAKFRQEPQAFSGVEYIVVD